MAGLRAEVADEGGLLVVFGFGVGALGAAEHAGYLDEAPAVEHKASPPTVGDVTFFSCLMAGI